jgi:endonuclease/exonuclease/phosphatase (EEP) superfamily protein YafD
MKKISRRTLRLVTSFLIAFPALIVMFAPSVYAFTPFASYQWLIQKSVQMMWIYFGVAIILLMFAKKYWMFLSFGCCAALCMFLKYTSNDAFAFAEKTQGMEIKIANFNISSVTDSLESVAKSIGECDADLISIQESNPVEDSLLRLRLVSHFPYIYSHKSKDYYGMMIFSKFPFGKVDTFTYKGIPNIIGCVNIDKEKCKFNFIASYLLPPVNANAYEQLRGHLGTIAYKAKLIHEPLVTLGTYSTVPWSPEIQDFKAIGELSDSRLGFTPTYPNTSPTFFQVPYDHIFHSKYLKCIGFKTIKTASKEHTGIEGIFQFINPADDSLSTSKNR